MTATASVATPAARPPTLHPLRLLLLALLANLLLCLLATALALRTPVLGLALTAAEDPAQPPQEQVDTATAQRWQLPPGDYRLLALRGPAGELALRSDDLLEEPDVLDTYAAMADFFARQQTLTALLQEPLQLTLQNADGQQRQVDLRPRPRQVSELPGIYWFQLTVDLIGCLIGVWVLALRPRDWGARMFAVTGLSFPLFTLPAAIYSSRELALPGELFRLLSSLNHFGAISFGCGLVALFLCHPRPLIPLRWLAAVPLLFGGWWLADALRLAPDQDWGARFPVMLQMSLAVVCGLLQWRGARHRPADRAALRWLILSSLVGCGLFAFFFVGSMAIGWTLGIPQGYAFGFFLIMHVGLALGVYRYRLFDLDRWSYRILLWVLGAAMVIGLDATLISLISLEPGTALGITLLACGWIYFPLRQLLWHWLLGRQENRLHDCLPELVAIAFASQPAARLQRWQAILRQLFAPLDLTPCETANVAAQPTTQLTAQLADNGLALQVPAVAGLPALRLAYRDQGRRLFSPRDAAFVTTLCQLMQRAADSRDAYERGVREERHRLAEDMHDDIGARLLMLIHRADNPAQAELARAAMTDLRTAIAALDSPVSSLAEALADWRAQIAERCELAGCELRWQADANADANTTAQPGPLLDPRRRANLERALREAVSNAIRHAAPGRLYIDISLEPGPRATQLRLRLRHDGRLTPPAEWTPGHGTRNMEKRLRSIAGSYSVALGDDGWLTTTFTLPLPAPTENA